MAYIHFDGEDCASSNDKRLLSSRGLYEGTVISELGVFGVYLWKRGPDGQRPEIIEERDPCWSFKTKNSEVDEMSVVKGYGCFDSLALVHDDIFVACMESS